MPKKRTLAERVNEEMDGYGAAAKAERKAFRAVEDFDAPVTDDFAMEDEAGGPSKQRRVGERKLRRRAPLDANLSSGKYDAKPVTASEAEGRMDALFSMLDDEGLDAEEAAAGLDTEEKYAEWLDKQHDIRTKTAPKGSEQDLLQQIAALKQRQTQAMETVAAAPAHTQDEAATARVMTDATAALVSLRTKLQPLVHHAVALPQYYAFGAYLKEGGKEAKEVRQALRADFVDVVADLLAVRKETCPAVGKTGKDVTDALWTAIEKSHQNAMEFVDASIDFWGKRTAPPQRAKLNTIAAPELDQIKAIITNKARLLQRAHTNRAHLTILGHPDHFTDDAEAKVLRIADGDVDEEIFNDSDFLKELIHRNASWLTQQQAEEQAMVVKQGSSKKEWYKKTKGRELCMDPRPKLVNFMAPQPYDEEKDRNDALLASLFSA